MFTTPNKKGAADTARPSNTISKRASKCHHTYPIYPKQKGRQALQYNISTEGIRKAVVSVRRLLIVAHAWPIAMTVEQLLAML